MLRTTGPPFQLERSQQNSSHVQNGLTAGPTSQQSNSGLMAVQLDQRPRREQNSSRAKVQWWTTV